MRSRPFSVAEVDADALLPPVGVLQEHVHVAHRGHDAARGKAAHGVAALGVLDLDDLGAPVGQDGRGRRNEGVLGHLQDANAFHDVCQRGSLPWLCVTTQLRWGGAALSNRCAGRRLRGPVPPRAPPRPGPRRCPLRVPAPAGPACGLGVRRRPTPARRAGSAPPAPRPRSAIDTSSIQRPPSARASRLAWAAVNPVSGSATASAQKSGDPSAHTTRPPAAAASSPKATRPAASPVRP